VEPVVSLEGAQKLTGANPDGAAKPSGVPGRPVPGLPLDGRNLVCAALDSGTILVAGAGDSFVPTLPATLNDDPRATVPCTIVSLPRPDKMTGKQMPFVGVLPLESISPVELQRITIRSKGHAHAFAVKPGPVDLGDFLSLVADALPLSLSSLIDRLIDALFAGSSDQKNREVAAAIVRHAAKRNGFVELIGGFDEGDLFLQGWSKDLPAGSNRVFVYDGTLKVADLTCCLGERKEAGGKVSGFFALMEAAETLVPETVQSVFFRGRNGWNKVDMHDRGSISQPRALPGHIRALLPRLSAGGEGRAKLERASWRFDGRDTVGELNVPVRIGVDFSIATDGAGVLLAGWLLDPEDHVSAVMFRSGTLAFRLDETWTTQDRPDVTSTFEELSPFLNGPAAQHRHGFLAFVPTRETLGGGGSYFEIVLKDGRSAYSPLVLGKAPLRSALRCLVAGVGPTVSSETDVIERQFLPFLQKTTRPAPEIVDTQDFGAVPDTASRSIVIGLDGNLEKIRTLLPVFALDPMLRGTPLVVSASETVLGQQIQEIKRLAGFYGLALRVVVAANVEDKLDALQVGLEAAPSDTAVCFSSSIIPDTPGWLEPLMSAFQERDSACLVTPTILYEDDTIRWAGSWIDQDGGASVLKQHYVGYPRRTLQGAESCDVFAATFDCCVLPRTALADVGGFERHYLGTDEKGIDATLKLRRSGLGAHWVPQVEMIHPEDGNGSEGLWHRLVVDLDRKLFERAWSPALAALKGRV